MLSRILHGYGGYSGRGFEQTYRCYSAATFNKPHLEGGDKVIMPASALHRLATLHIDYPMLFELSQHGDAAHRITHCGVLEFVADEGTVIMPRWMMHGMRLDEGGLLVVKSASLPKGGYVKLQPHTGDFLDTANPKAVLEKTLRSFTCLTTGDTITVAYNNKEFLIDIVETKPASAICIIETDCEVDFAPPLDYKEPEKVQQKPSVPASKATSEDQEVKDEPKFRAFTGSGNRLDGKASKPQAAEISTNPAAAGSAVADSNKKVNQETVAAASSGGSKSTRQKKGKLVFGSNKSSSKEPEKAPPVKVDELAKKEEPKFQAFSGTSYSLKQKMVISSKGKVCVTGASGFVASWLIKRLLEAGYHVIGTVRDPSNREKVSHLWRLPGAKEKLQLEEMLVPAINGTLNVLKSCKKNPFLKRVVLTSSSSTVRIRDESKHPEISLDETIWSSVPLCEKLQLWYALAKISAEKAAWEFAKENNIDLVTVLPSFVIGPSLSHELSVTALDILGLLQGDTERFSSYGRMGYVHIDDVASCHILVYEAPQATGRYLCNSVVLDNNELVALLAKQFPIFPIPRSLRNPYEKQSYELNTSKIQQLDFKFKGVQEMFGDCVESLKDQGHLLECPL
uniref:NAD-dependent epimerase/dehydratase domain-containing protein n=1 Tax=Oryza punctata TaxID=4537 RepID=A0A0E0M2V4_ORYPU